MSVLIQLTGTNVVAKNKAAQLDRLMDQAHASGVFKGTVLVAENGKVTFRWIVITMV